MSFSLLLVSVDGAKGKMGENVYMHGLLFHLCSALISRFNDSTMGQTMGQT